MATPIKLTTNSRCTVCNHLQRHAIEMAHCAGASLDAIAKKFSTDANPIHRASVHRHCRDHLDESLRASLLADIPLTELAARAAKEGMSLIESFSLVRSTVIQQMLVADGVNDGNRVAVLAGRSVEVLNAIGKITGELSNLASLTIELLA